ncbi:hypothetical protein PMAYCL1PPCAC_03220, partial [Pristionchus mayeri]
MSFFTSFRLLKTDWSWVEVDSAFCSQELMLLRMDFSEDFNSEICLLYPFTENSVSFCFSINFSNFESFRSHLELSAEVPFSSKPHFSPVPQPSSLSQSSSSRFENSPGRILSCSRARSLFEGDRRVTRAGMQLDSAVHLSSRSQQIFLCSAFRCMSFAEIRL